MLIKLLEFPLKLTRNLALFLAATFTISSVITWIAARQAVIIVSTILIYSLGTMALLAGLVATFLFILEYSDVFRTRRAEARRDRILASAEGKRAKLENDRAKMHLSAEGRVLAATVRQIERGLIYSNHLADAKFSAFPAAIAKQIDNGAVPLLEVPPPPAPLLPLLKEKEPDAGKTTLLRHIVDTKMEMGKVLVIDPHGNTPKWGHTSHIGQGRDFRGIGIMLGQIVKEITTRYEAEISRPELIGKHPYVTVVVDELRAIINECKDAGKNLGTILCEGRKANIHICFVAHSKTVKGLGIQGEGDIRTGISQVTLYGNKDTERYATHHIIGFDEPVKMQLPGPYPDRVFNRQVSEAKAAPAATPVTDEPAPASIFSLDVMPENAADMMDQAVIDCYLETGSYAAAYKVLRGGSAKRDGERNP
jgi:hypothetical protein